MPQYLLQIYSDDSDAAFAQVTPEQQQGVMEAYTAFTNDVKARGLFQGGEALERSNTAKTVRVQDGKTVVTDGPFAETKEQLGGYYLVSCNDIDEAIETAARIPGAQWGAIEVRKVMEFPEQEG
jgi:hypothetical protein